VIDSEAAGGLQVGALAVLGVNAAGGYTRSCKADAWACVKGDADGETVLGMGERRLAHHQGSTRRGGKQSPHRLYRS